MSEGTNVEVPSKFLSVIKEFTSVYEDRLKFIDKEVGADCHEIKIPVYKRWVEDLTIQNTELVRSIEELETVVSDRLHLLEERLQQEKYNLHDRRVYHLENDLHNLLLFLRRALQENNWSTDGLVFQDINLDQILLNYREEQEPDVTTISTENSQESNSSVIEEDLDNISREVLSIKDDMRNSVVVQTQDERTTRSYEENMMLREKVETGDREITLLKARIKELEKGTIDTQVLAQEIATKHDTIQKMRSDNAYLEEQIRHASMQIQFKDNVIKELRRDVANLKKIETNGNSLESSSNDLSKSIPTTEVDPSEMVEHQKEPQRMLQCFQEEINQLTVELQLEIPKKTLEHDVVPEMLSAIKHELFNLKKTNSLLCVENAEMRGDAEQLREKLENFASQSEHLNEQGKQLEEMQQVLTKLRNTCKNFGGNQAAISDIDLLANISDMLEDLKRDNVTKNSDMAEKDKKIETLVDLNEKQRMEIDILTKTKDCWIAEREKNENMIEELKKAIEMHMDTVNELKSANDDLTKRLSQPNEIFAKLLADKTRLEVECHHQMTTISNLKAAVENIKKDTKPVSSPSSGSSSLWSWWRTVHDV